MSKKKERIEGVEGTAVTESGAVESSVEGTFLDEDKDGNRLLPGQEIPVAPEIKPLIEKVRLIENTLKPNFGKARDALTAAQADVSRIAHENIQFFSEPDENGMREYKSGGVIVKITFEKEKIVTKLEEE